MVVEVFREADGRLQGVLETPDGRRDAFVSTLDLLRVLEGLELPRDPGTASTRTGPGCSPGRQRAVSRTSRVTSSWPRCWASSS